jgi:manganese/zinc/iron transport system substrate-binding protein
MLFPESNVSQDSIKKIVQAGQEKGMELKIGCCPLYADAMGSPGSEGDTYLKMITYNAKMIASYLKNNKK